MLLPLIQNVPRMLSAQGVLHGTASAVVDLLADGTFAKEFTPEISYDTDLILEDASTIRVDVVPASLVQVPDSRVSLRYEVGVDVAVRYRFGTSDQETDGKVSVDKAGAYLALLEELAEYLADPDNRKPSTKAMAVWSSNDIRTPWVSEHLRNNRQYTGIFRANYIVAVDL